MIEVDAFSVTRGGELVVEVEAFRVDEELVAVMGPNGAGKTSLLLALAGRLPYEGRLEAGETWLTRADPPERVAVSPAELVEGHGVEEASSWVEEVGYRGPSSLARGSAGERKLVALAGALGRRGCDLLLDEPFGPLDPPHVARLLPLFRERARRDAVVFSTHDPLAAAGADRVVLLNKRIVAQGPPREVLEEQALSTCYGASMSVEWTRLGPVIAAE